MLPTCAGVFGVLAITLVSHGLCAVIPPAALGTRQGLAQIAADLEYPGNELAALREQDEASRDFHETANEESRVAEDVHKPDADDDDDDDELPVETDETEKADGVGSRVWLGQKADEVDTGPEAPGVERDVTYDTPGGLQDREDLGDWRKHDMANIRVIEVNQTLYLNHTEEDGQQPRFQPVRMPENFQDYDVNHDGRITLSELRDVTRAVEGAAEALSAADVDGDGRLNEEEFRATMWGRSPGKAPSRNVILMPSEDIRPSEIPRLADSTPPVLRATPLSPRVGRRRHVARPWAR